MLLCTVSMVFLLQLQSKALCPSAQQQQAEKVTLGLYLALYPAKFSSCPLYVLYVIYDISNGVYGIFYGFINSSRCVPRYFYGLYAILYGFYGTSYGLNSNHRLFMVFPMGLVGCHISYTIYHSNMVSISRFCSMTLVLLRKCSNGLYAVP